MTLNREGNSIILFAILVFVILLLGAHYATIAIWPLWIPILLWSLAGLFFLWVLFNLMFFRKPSRRKLTDSSIVYAPADGKIVVVEEVEETEYLGQKRMQVSVFMSLTNVHMNWYPVSGRVEYFKYHPGQFIIAWEPKSSELNERTTTVIDTGKHKILFRQIAGYVARRIVSYMREGDQAEQNTKCGFIKFGSRVDLFLPCDSEIMVRVGDRVTGSQTPLARLR